MVQAWVTFVSYYDGVSCVQTNTLTEIIIAGFLKKMVGRLQRAVKAEKSISAKISDKTKIY